MHMVSKRFTDCIIRKGNLMLTAEQDLRRKYYELIFRDVLEVMQDCPTAILDLTLLEHKRQEVYIVDTPARLRKKLRKAFGENVTERVINGKGSSGLCKLHGFS